MTAKIGLLLVFFFVGLFLVKHKVSVPESEFIIIRLWYTTKRIVTLGLHNLVPMVSGS